MAARRTALGLVVALGFYLVVFGDRAVILLTQRRLALRGLGVAVLLVGVVGAYLVAAEVRFGLRSSRLGRELGPDPDAPPLARRPSGRVDRVAADAEFARRRALVEAAPDDWRGWYRLGIAYGDAGDTKRGRAAVRHAIALHAAARADEPPAPAR